MFDFDRLQYTALDLIDRKSGEYIRRGDINPTFEIFSISFFSSQNKLPRLLFHSYWSTEPYDGKHNDEPLWRWWVLIQTVGISKICYATPFTLKNGQITATAHFGASYIVHTYVYCITLHV